MPRADIAGTGILVLVACAVPLGLAQRVLIGSSQVARATMLLSSAPVLSLMIVAGARRFDSPAYVYATAPATAALVANCFTWPSALKVMGVNLRRLIAVRPPRESYRTVLRLGLPSLVIVTATAATFQSDRLILSHLSTPDELGRYALVAPVWAGVTSVVAVAGQTLWPWYRQKRVSDGLGFGEVKRNMGLFAFIGAGGATVLLVMGALVITLQTSGTVSPPWPVLAAAAGSVLMQALILPLAMLLTAPDEWRVQAWITVGVATISVVVTSLLCPVIGASGAYIGTALSILLFQLPLTMAFASRRLRPA